MSCVRHAFPLVFATVMAVTGTAAVAADETTPSASPRPVILATPATPPAAVAAPAAEPKNENRTRAISPAAAAQLAAAVPKFEPPPPNSNPATTASAEAPVDLREVDRPRNTIIRLPSYLVREEKPVILTEREVQTPKARLQLALKKHPGLRLGSFWIFRNDGIALAMLAEEERLEQKQHFEDLVQLMHFSDPASKATAKQSVEGTFMRTADFGR